MNEQTSLPAAAARLSVPWHAAYRLALSGQLGPVVRERTGWVVTTTGVDAYLRSKNKSAVQDGGEVLA